MKTKEVSFSEFPRRRLSLLRKAFRHNRPEKTKFCPIPPSLSDRNGSDHRFSTDKKLMSDFLQLKFLAQTIAQSSQTFRRDILSPALFAIPELIEPSIAD
ncbi:hypothetical protein [Burkholderia territorii]|uniref:hypothetical protein n=1 Tax=Burkholderia territorii TaxID=1503055 RepID=UPI0012D9B321|nr:hypothetical protein [Burkholderia territorii]